MKLDDAIIGRRSVRKFSDHYVTKMDLKQILEAKGRTIVPFRPWK